MSKSFMMTPTFAAAAINPNLYQAQIPRRFFSPDGGASDAPPSGGEPEQPEYIKTMMDSKDWQDALDNRKRPVLI